MEEIYSLRRKINQYDNDIDENNKRIAELEEAYDECISAKNKILNDKDKIQEIESFKKEQVGYLSQIENSRFVHRYCYEAGNIASGIERNTAYTTMSDIYDNLTKIQSDILDRIDELIKENTNISNEIANCYREISTINNS